MNAQQIENQKIWKQVKGAEKLFEIYLKFISVFRRCTMQRLKILKSIWKEKNFI